MDFMQLAAARYSVRRFSPEPVAQSIIDTILEAGRLAPTGCNYQPQRVLVMQSEQALEKMRKCTSSHFHAPLGMLVCYDKTQCWVREYDGEPCGYADACIVATHMMLAAFEQGVGSTWVAHFDPAAMRREFAIPENIVPVALLSMGYPAPDARPAHLHAASKPASALVTYDTF